MTRNQNLSLLFVSSQLTEQLLHVNHEFLNDLSKIRFQTAVRHVKWLNKDFESYVPHKIEDLEEDTAELYEMANMIVKATEKVKNKEFIEYIKAFDFDK